MKKSSLSLLVAIGGAACLLGFLLLSDGGVEGVYFAHPPQLATSVDFRSDGTMFMAAGDEGAWFSWRREKTRIIAEGVSGAYKGRVIAFDVKGGELFLGRMRFIKAG